MIEIRDIQDGDEIPSWCTTGGAIDWRKAIRWVCEDLSNAEIEEVYRALEAQSPSTDEIKATIRDVLSRRGVIHDARWPTPPIGEAGSVMAGRVLVGRNEALIELGRLPDVMLERYLEPQIRPEIRKAARLERARREALDV